MIHKAAKYGNIENVTVAEFGKGTLSITDGANREGFLSLLIKSKEFSPIGKVSGSEKDSDEFKPELALVFHNKQSFDVFLEYVENIKEKFNAATAGQKSRHQIIVETKIIGGNPNHPKLNSVTRKI